MVHRLESLESRQLMATDLEINSSFGAMPVETVELSVVNGGFEDISGRHHSMSSRSALSMAGTFTIPTASRTEGSGRVTLLEH
ncbi:MAG: hypothetical protein R3C05_06825 [Pirellulaceae bacterium]